MLEEIKESANIAYTQNGAVTNASTYDPCLDFFAISGAMRGIEEDRIITVFSRAFAASADNAMRILFYTRDIRGGLGERRVFRIILEYLANNFPETVKRNLNNIPEYGRFDDLLVLVDTPCEDILTEYISKTIKADLFSMSRNEGVSLLAKWLPSVNASDVVRKEQAKRIAKRLGMTEKEYRKTLSSLKSYIDILEKRLCTRNYSFDYEKQPSKALYKYRKAFIRNDRIRYMQFVKAASEGMTQLKTGSLYPYEIIRSSTCSLIGKDEEAALDASWRSLPDYCDGKNAIAVIDGSASMEGMPMNIATSLGIYFAERNKGFFHNHFITFSQNPRLVEIHGETIVDKAMYCMSYNEVSNTDLIKVFMLILESAVRNNLKQSDLPEIIYVISDMEFDMGVCKNMSLHNEVDKLFRDKGYILPQVVYWNVNSSGNNYTVTSNQYNTVLVSGSSPVIFEMVISQNITPRGLMMNVICSDRYRHIYA